jgi:hypothetical protein
MDAQDKIAAASHRCNALESQLRQVLAELRRSEEATARSHLREADLTQLIRELRARVELLENATETWPPVDLLPFPPGFTPAPVEQEGAVNLTFICESPCGAAIAVGIKSTSRMGVCEIFHRLFPAPDQPLRTDGRNATG